jgi:hypothetical protein
MELTRAEHLEWAKQRALEYLEVGDSKDAFASMISDLKKHPELENHAGLSIGICFLLLPGWITNKQKLREWIVGFN